jgi:hypothetical protein
MFIKIGFSFINILYIILVSINENIKDSIFIITPSKFDNFNREWVRKKTVDGMESMECIWM